MIITKDILIEKEACEEGLDFVEKHNLYNLDSKDLALKLLELKEFNYFFWFVNNFKIKDTKSMRDKITDSYSAYLYCRYIKDRKDMRDKITDSFDAYHYCQYVKDRKEIRDKITESEHAYWYYETISKKDKRLNELAKQFKKGVL